jgi:hypothetical protein
MNADRIEEWANVGDIDRFNITCKFLSPNETGGLDEKTS